MTFSSRAQQNHCNLCHFPVGDKKHCNLWHFRVGDKKTIIICIIFESGTKKHCNLLHFRIGHKKKHCNLCNFRAGDKKNIVIYEKEPNEQIQSSKKTDSQNTLRGKVPKEQIQKFRLSKIIMMEKFRKSRFKSSVSAGSRYADRRNRARTGI